jgi:hypothetical protein
LRRADRAKHVVAALKQQSGDARAQVAATDDQGRIAQGAGSSGGSARPTAGDSVSGQPESR